mgnify:CR=1 FL=1
MKRNKVITNDQTRIEALEKLKTIVEFNQNGKWGETLYNAKNIIIKTVKDITSIWKKQKNLQNHLDWKEKNLHIFTIQTVQIWKL